MKKRFALFAMAAAFAVGFMVNANLPTTSAHGPERVYELRTYTTHEGKLDELHMRFRNHTNGLFVKHGMTLIGYWTPTEGDAAKNTLIYVLAHPNRDAAKESWGAFSKDPVWREAYAASREDGPIVQKVESVFMQATDYSPLQ
jgi:hypothetical protein